MPTIDAEEAEALREEARYWRRQAKIARAQRDQSRQRVRDIAAPRVEVIEGETYWRVYVNGEYVDGQEERSVADTIAHRLRKAFEVK
jgi:hypothetical protein